MFFDECKLAGRMGEYALPFQVSTHLLIQKCFNNPYRKVDTRPQMVIAHEIVVCRFCTFRFELH
jgi:hypothetical protein